MSSTNLSKTQRKHINFVIKSFYWHEIRLNALTVFLYFWWQSEWLRTEMHTVGIYQYPPYRGYP